MAKRSWSAANEAEGTAVVSPDAPTTPTAHQNGGAPNGHGKSSSSNGTRPSPGNPSTAISNGIHDLPLDSSLPQISRKIKACAACRKHKIKCIMDERGPPCRRCEERNLGCVLKKSIQSILDEKAHYVDAVVHDLEQLHSALEIVVGKFGLPPLAPLQSNLARLAAASSSADPPGPSEMRLMVPLQPNNDLGPSCDNSPELIPVDESFPYAPIHSLYTLTKLRALRSPDASKGDQSQAIDDFVTLGAISKADAERLFCLYRDRLDGFMYGVGCVYDSLDQMRGKSSILTAAVLTVAALHDPQANVLYGVCRSEFRRLVEKSMFERRVDRDYIRAMCVASYWLSDMSWILSGHAIRRTAECNLPNQHNLAIEGQNEEATDWARLWFIINICDQHLAILYGRSPIVRDESSIQMSESFLNSPASNEEDTRLVSQVSLLNIFMAIQEFSGPDNGRPIPRAYGHQISHFDKQLDSWIDHWTVTMQEENPRIGRFPRKGARLHYHFAKLHLHSLVFRGLTGDSPIPYYFLDSATAAVSAAIATIEFICNDPDVSAGVVGMPSYLHGMMAFACTFLIKLAVKYGGQLVEPARVYELVTGLVQHFRSLMTSKWHHAHLMASGLERMVATMRSSRGHQASQQPNGFMSRDGLGDMTDVTAQMYSADGPLLTLDAEFFLDPHMGLDLSPGFPVDIPTLSIDHSQPGIEDFSGLSTA